MSYELLPMNLMFECVDGADGDCGDMEADLLLEAFDISCIMGKCSGGLCDATSCFIMVTTQGGISGGRLCDSESRSCAASVSSTLRPR